MVIFVNTAIGQPHSVSKDIDEMSLSELKQAYNVRLVENNIHPNSAFKKFIDAEMIEIANRIKILRKQ